jgi:hypothetical protein
MRSEAEVARPLSPPQDAWPRRLPQLKIAGGGAIAFGMPLLGSEIMAARQAPVEQAEQVTL